MSTASPLTRLSDTTETTIGFEAFIGVLSQGKSLDDYPYLIDARTMMFNQLVWWARALAPARAQHTLATAQNKAANGISG